MLFCFYCFVSNYLFQWWYRRNVFCTFCVSFFSSFRSQCFGFDVFDGAEHVWNALLGMCVHSSEALTYTKTQRFTIPILMRFWKENWSKYYGSGLILFNSDLNKRPNVSLFPSEIVWVLSGFRFGSFWFNASYDLIFYSRVFLSVFM